MPRRMLSSVRRTRLTAARLGTHDRVKSVRRKARIWATDVSPLPASSLLVSSPGAGHDSDVSPNRGRGPHHPELRHYRSSRAGLDWLHVGWPRRVDADLWDVKRRPQYPRLAPPPPKRPPPKLEPPPDDRPPETSSAGSRAAPLCIVPERPEHATLDDLRAAAAARRRTLDHGFARRFRPGFLAHLEKPACHARVESERRRQLNEQRPPLPAEAVRLVQKRRLAHERAGASVRDVMRRPSADSVQT